MEEVISPREVVDLRGIQYIPIWAKGFIEVVRLIVGVVAVRKLLFMTGPRNLYREKLLGVGHSGNSPVVPRASKDECQCEVSASLAIRRHFGIVNLTSHQRVQALGSLYADGA